MSTFAVLRLQVYPWFCLFNTGIEPRALFIWGKHSTNWASFPDPNLLLKAKISQASPVCTFIYVCVCVLYFLKKVILVGVYLGIPSCGGLNVHSLGSQFCPFIIMSAEDWAEAISVGDKHLTCWGISLAHLVDVKCTSWIPNLYL